MYSLDAAAVKRWIAVQDHWFPGAISTTCPTCANLVIFSSEQHAYDIERDTIAASATCPSCDETIALWGIHPNPAGSTSDKGCARIVMYPEPPHRTAIAGTNLVPDRVQNAYRDALKAYNAGIWSATNVSCRVTLEGIVQNLLGGPKGRGTLEKHIQQLATTVDLSQPLITLANMVRSGGNIGAHFDEQKEADRDTAEAMVDLIEYLLEYVYTLPGMVTQLDQRIAALGQPKPAPTPVPPVTSVSSTIVSDGQSEDRLTLRLRFWAQLLERAKEKGVLTHKGRNPIKDYWLDTGAGQTGISYIYLIYENHAEVKLGIATSDASRNKRIFELLLQHRNEIESVFGNPLNWNQREDRKSADVVYYMAGSGLRSNAESWLAIQDCMITAMSRLVAAFTPFINALPRRDD